MFVHLSCGAHGAQQGGVGVLGGGEPPRVGPGNLTLLQKPYTICIVDSSVVPAVVLSVKLCQP